MLAFGLAWVSIPILDFIVLSNHAADQIVAVIDSDVIGNRAFTEGVVTKRRRHHFLEIYRKLVNWLKTLRNGTPIPGLSQTTRAEAVQALDRLADLSLPDLSIYEI